MYITYPTERLLKDNPEPCVGWWWSSEYIDRLCHWSIKIRGDGEIEKPVRHTQISRSQSIGFFMRQTAILCERYTYLPAKGSSVWSASAFCSRLPRSAYWPSPRNWTYCTDVRYSSSLASHSLICSPAVRYMDSVRQMQHESISSRDIDRHEKMHGAYVVPWAKILDPFTCCTWLQITFNQWFTFFNRTCGSSVESECCIWLRIDLFF